MSDWSDRQPGPAPGAKGEDPFDGDAVVAVEEPGRSPLRLLVSSQSIEVGRDCSGVLLSDPQVSRRHISMRSTRGGVEVRDLGSANGTLFGEIPLNGPRLLGEGDAVRLGSTVVRLLACPSEDRRGARSPRSGRGLATATSIDLVAAAALDGPRPDVNLLAGDGGTLTIVFSDIEQSTQRAVQLGDERWLELLGAHNSIVRRHVSRQGGTEVKAQGDGFLLSFSSARRGLRAMVDVQRALAAHARSRPADSLRVRVGIHTGEVTIAEDGDVFGRHVILASRIAGAARGGEILASALVHELLEPHAEFVFAAPRRVELKGLDGAQLVHPVRWDR
ncbi:MAG: adenylate/guanylate cyclase domain-containing protein [Acidimicrobiia bacterium]|nr:adenylate/guanylate cyclase domain-containing protein [Acidimicrobiia bacterium]